MIFFSVVPPVMTLRLLNEFRVPELYTPSVKSVVRDDNPAWRPFAVRLKDKLAAEREECRTSERRAACLNRR